MNYKPQRSWTASLQLKQIEINNTNLFKMNEAHSFSFPSFESYNYPSNNNLTFHEIEINANSQYNISKDSMIRNFPGTKFPMGPHLEIVLLLQAAEIERLTISLQQYRTKFKRLSNNQKDYFSFQNQANELLHVKDELQLKSQKMNYFVESQKGELIDATKYAQSLQSKYKRALKFIEEAYLAKQKLESANRELIEQIQTLERTFEAFKEESIKQYQSLREELQKSKNHQLSFQVNKFNSQKQRWADILARQQNKLTQQKHQIQQALRQEQAKASKAVYQLEHLQKQVQQSRDYIDSLSQNNKKLQRQKQETLALIGSQIERLNFMLKERLSQQNEASQKIAELNETLERSKFQIGELNRQSDRYKQKNQLYEQQILKQNGQISRLSTYVSSLTTKMNEMSILVEQKNVEIRIKENKLHQEIENYNGVLSKSEYVFNKEIEEFKLTNIALAKEIQQRNIELSNRDQAYRQKQTLIATRLKEAEAARDHLRTELSKIQTINRQNEEKLRYQNIRLQKDIESLKKKEQQFKFQKKQVEQKFRREQTEYLQGSRHIYEDKLREVTYRLMQNEQKQKHFDNIKSALEDNIKSLKLALQRSEKNREDLQRNRTFQQLITEIENLCQATIKKDNQISELRQDIYNLHQQLKKQTNEIQSLRDVLIKIMNTQNLSDTKRKEQYKHLLQDVKKLFKQQSIKFDEIIDANHNLTAICTNKTKHISEESQNYLLKSKDDEINELKTRINQIDRQSNNKIELKQIISKIIAITKDNSQLKNQMNKKSLQLDHQIRLYNQLKQQSSKMIQNLKTNLKEKDEICRKLLEQLDESHNLLELEKQSQMTLQSNLFEQQEYTQQSQHEQSAKEELIKEMKQNYRKQCQQSSAYKDQLQEERRNCQHLREQIRGLMEKHSYEIIMKDEQIQSAYREGQKWKAQSFAQENRSRNMLEQQIKGLVQNIEDLNNRMSKLKNQNNILIQENQQLKDQTVKASNSIFSLTEENQSLKEWEIKYNGQVVQCQGHRLKISELLGLISEKEVLNCQFQTARMQNDIFKRQQEKSQKILMNYSEKVDILTTEFQRLQGIISDLKIKNSQMMSSNYEMSVNLERSKVWEQKVSVLNEEIHRLERERMNLTEQISLCRMNFSQDSQYQRQVKQQLGLLVLLFAEIEALRARLAAKELELNEQRRNGLPK